MSESSTVRTYIYHYTIYTNSINRKTFLDELLKAIDSYGSNLSYFEDAASTSNR